MDDTIAHAVTIRKSYKRPVDIVVSTVLLALISPLFLLIPLLIRLDSPGPVFFTQIRFGQGGRLFKLYKFRTMTDVPRRPNEEIMLSNPEVTTLGRFLRRYKIDELPQIWNVLIGDMSLVGPRPGIAEQLVKLDHIGKKRLLVRPGLTGLAQISGNIYLSWPERWRYDAQYVEKQSFWLDCRILWHTLSVVINGEQINRRKKE